MKKLLMELAQEGINYVEITGQEARLQKDSIRLLGKMLMLPEEKTKEIVDKVEEKEKTEDIEYVRTLDRADADELIRQVTEISRQADGEEKEKLQEMVSYLSDFYKEIHA